MTESSPVPSRPSIDFLRAATAQLGVQASDDDLDAVMGFLDVVLPRLEEIERRLPPGTAA